MALNVAVRTGVLLPDAVYVSVIAPIVGTAVGTAAVYVVLNFSVVTAPAALRLENTIDNLTPSAPPNGLTVESVNVGVTTTDVVAAPVARPSRFVSAANLQYRSAAKNTAVIIISQCAGFILYNIRYIMKH
jgi:hypothetical protein